ncbi:unnamed protein product [Cylicostephanus goldi]|uniref:Uncharacterized protein n=1 Tax=Cylicostephanus goldi TaxID=71465 RepID=A0A3P6QZ43_CYLGO|nr:unnamed protein product [Cylicostephanus goldi]
MHLNAQTRVLTQTVPIKIAALVGEDELSGPPLSAINPKSRFRNGHASFRLRMLQEQHGTGFEPVSFIPSKSDYVMIFPGAVIFTICFDVEILI